MSSLSSDPGLHALVPFLSICTYQLSLDAMNAKDLRLFWAAAWFYRAMVCNPYMHLTLYLQRILPGLATLVANSKVTEGDHWAPRVFSAMTTAMVVERYAVIYPPLRGQVRDPGGGVGGGNCGGGGGNCGGEITREKVRGGGGINN